MSVSSATHALPHAVVPLQYEQSTPPSESCGPPHPNAYELLPHVDWHVPPAHTSPSAHATPQPPQLRESVIVSTQAAVEELLPPPHAVVPVGQPVAQRPFAHAPPPGQIGPQEPALHTWPSVHA